MTILKVDEKKTKLNLVFDFLVLMELIPIF